MDRSAGAGRGMTWEREADMVREFVAAVEKDQRNRNPWTIYPETAGWDLLLVHRDGYQVGIEAKLILNAKVIEQALSNADHSFWGMEGPDYRAVLVPEGKIQNHLSKICTHIGIGVIKMSRRWFQPHMALPDEASNYRPWPNWCPSRRCTLPDYVPDVEGGHSAPLRLTIWKIKAIKLCILLERRGYVTRADFKALQISPTRWTAAGYGMLNRDVVRKVFIRGDRTPDYRKEHPRNFAEIEADFDKWGKPLLAEDLLGTVAA